MTMKTVGHFLSENEEQWKAGQNPEDYGVSLISGDREYASLLVPPQIFSKLNDKLLQMTFELTSSLKILIDLEKVNQDKIVDGRLEWDRYYTLEDIHQSLDDLASINNATASTFSIGTSYEGREMKAIKISKSGETDLPFGLTLIFTQESESTWITGAVCNYIIDQLLNSNETEIQSWLDEYDFYILPIANPDGYEFTHTTDRFWRKSRSENGSPVGCIGTDLNRNFDFHWLENGGASSNPCSNTFAGNSPFSDSEAANMRDFLTSISSRLVFYLSLHSSGQYILFPTGFDDTPIPQYNTYMSIGNLAAEAHGIRHGTNFTAGSVYNLMYTATGSSMDWTWNALKANLTFTYELRDKGQFGHLLPPDQIYPSATEFMDGLKVIMTELSREYLK
ncbi:Zinc carboxypeptidase [Orchesella cincta]|uniref:Zinc carboxypeptidase n=1 Tax=Orchesella cincta TaxID=48709 RepID=A0A1D2M212_ORCCI|nr:Zinc carboxypeptidase [Orchesella cincta]